MIVGEEKENILDLHSFDCDVEEYQQAKERCLFEGFENYPNHKNAVVSDNLIFKLEDFKKIEDVVKYKLLLTQTAQEQSGI